MKKMLLTEYNEAETMALFKEEGFEEGFEEGLEEGQNRYSSLILKLLSDGRNDDIAKVVENDDYRDKLYIEYGIVRS